MREAPLAEEVGVSDAVDLPVITPEGVRTDLDEADDRKGEARAAAAAVPLLVIEPLDSGRSTGRGRLFFKLVEADRLRFGLLGET